MFDTMMIAKRIKDARIAKNMTQMNLADELGVSYQAVSNWERGNSMPDISKLGDLCTALNLTVDELLGVENKSTAAVNKIMQNEEVTPEELAEVAPILPPEDIQQLVKDMSTLAKNITEETLKKVPNKMGKLSVRMSRVFGEKRQAEENEEPAEPKKRKKRVDLSALAELAPFLDKEYLDEQVLNADLSDLDGLDELAPFLSKEALEVIAERASIDEMDALVDIAPFLSKQTIEKLIYRCLEENEGDMIEEFAPLASKESLDKLVDTVIEQNLDPEDLDWDISDIYPFLSKETLHKLAAYLVEQESAPDDLADDL